MTELTSFFWASSNGANGQITMTFHNYRYIQVQDTLNGLNQSSGFRDMRFAKPRPHLWKYLTSFWPMDKPIWGAWANDMRIHNYRPRQFHKTSHRENSSNSYQDIGSASLGHIMWKVSFDILQILHVGHYIHSKKMATEKITWKLPKCIITNGVRTHGYCKFS